MKKIIFLVVSLMAITLVNAQYASMAIIGNGVGGWPTGAAGEIDAHQMTSTDGIHWSISNLVTVNGSVKFRAANSWANNWGAPAGGAFPAGTGVFDSQTNITTPIGVYNVTFNSTTLAYSFTASSLYPVISLIGPGVGTGPEDWSTDLDLGTTDGIHYSRNGVAINGGVKFRKNHDWPAGNWEPQTFPSGTAVSDGAGALAIANDIYNVSFNLTTLEYAFNYRTIAIVGSGTPQGWPADPQTDAHVFTSVDGIHYVINSITLTSGAVKFRQDNNWNVQWGGDGGFPLGYGSQSGIDINIPAGTYSITLNRTTGAYSFGTPIGANTAPECTLIPVTAATASTGNAALATDGNTASRWESTAAGVQNITLDLGTQTTVSAVSITWDNYSAKDYFLRGSADGITWTDISEKTNMAYGARIDAIENINAQYRYIKIDGVTPNTQYGYAIYEINVCGTPIVPDNSKQILFIGNSYTYYNNLPTMVKNVAASVGDKIKASSYTVGGTSLEEHFQNTGTTGALQRGGWDYVVLQDHSQRPALDDAYVQTHTYAFAAQLADMARQYSPCTELFFYQTWGRKNGDAQYCPTIPEVCTYASMDDRLQQRYTQMANDNQGTISPVGRVRRELRQLHPEIELYTDDESHPTLAGTYVSAVTFYTVLFRKDPTLITYNTSILTATVANQIKAVVKTIVYDNLAAWNVGAYDPSAAFTFQAAGSTVTFTNTSVNGASYEWTFGDGTTSSEQNPEHQFTGSGPYTVTLTVTNCSRQSTTTREIALLNTTQFGRNNITAYPNPANSIWNITATNGAISSIQIMDMTGKTVMSISPKSDTAIVDASQLSTGIYMAKVSVGNAAQTIKLVKN